MPTSNAAIEETILRLLAECGPGKHLDPTEVARTLAGKDPNAWGRLMHPIRRVAIELAQHGRLVIYRKGKAVDPADFKGIYRLGAPRHD